MESEGSQPEAVTGPELQQEKNIPEEEQDDDLTQFEEPSKDQVMEIEKNQESLDQNSESRLEDSEKSEETAMEEDSEAVEVPESSELINDELSEEINLEENSENLNPEENSEAFEESEDGPVRISQLPLARVKRIMKTAVGDDPNVKLFSKESIFLVEQATELFIAAIAQETAKITYSSKKKTMTIQHLITTIKESENFAFLEGTMVPDYDF